MGLDVTVVETIERANASLKAQLYDAVFVDFNLPDGPGSDLATAYRKLESEQGRIRIPIIGMSSNTGSETERRCLVGGMDAFLPKPINVDQLSAALKRWLN
jgi:CheY-like chemotaxis protein